LLSIIKALKVDLNEFFDQLYLHEKEDALLIKPSEQEAFEKEYTKGSSYNRILSFKHKNQLIDFSVVFAGKKCRKRLCFNECFGT
jgi:hypothetical protein